MFTAGKEFESDATALQTRRGCKYAAEGRMRANRVHLLRHAVGIPPSSRSWKACKGGIHIKNSWRFGLGGTLGED